MNFVDFKTVHIIKILYEEYLDIDNISYVKRNEAQVKQWKSKPEPRQFVFNRFNDKPHFLCDCSHFKAKKVIICNNSKK